MEFNGTFELADTTTEEVWLALSDPVLVQSALPGCEFLVRVDDEDVDFDALREEHAGEERELTADPEVIEERAFEEGGHYAALVQLSVGPVNPTFETVVTIDRREFPEMEASGEGSSGDSSFEMASSMALSESDDGVAVDWETQADVFGRVAQMGQRVVNPVANRVVKRFFSSVQQELEDLEMATDGKESAASGADDGGVDDETGETETAEGGAEATDSDADSGRSEATESDAHSGRSEATDSDSRSESAEAGSGSTGAESERTDAGTESDDDNRSLLDRLLGR